MTSIRVALATGSIRLPQKHFILDHSLGFGHEAEAKLFTYAAKGMDSVHSIPFREFAPELPLAYNLRRRLYALGRPSLTSALAEWEPDVVHLHFLALGGFATAAAQRLNVPLVTTVHALEPHLMDTPRNRRQRYLQAECLDAMQATELFLPVSSYVAQWLASLGVPATSIQTNYLGVDTDFWSPSEVIADSEAPPRLLFVGNLTELKGVEDLIECSSQMRQEVDHTLEIIGSGPLRERVSELAAKDEHIHFRGPMDRLGVREAMNRAWCLVLPTRTQRGIAEAAGFVLMEAQSMGVPAVTFDVGGTAEMVASPDFLVKENDFDSLRNLLTRILGLDAGSREALGTHVREWTIANRSRDQGVRVTLDHYRNLLGQS